MKLVINTDGGARGNPGPAGIGVIIADEEGNVIARRKKYISHATNNRAEYQALILALKEAKKATGSREQASGGVDLEIRMDSELIVRQMQGRYKIKDPALKILATQVLKSIKDFKSATFRHIGREQNQAADKLVNEAIDGASKA